MQETRSDSSKSRPISLFFCFSILHHTLARIAYANDQILFDQKIDSDGSSNWKSFQLGSTRSFDREFPSQSSRDSEEVQGEIGQFLTGYVGGEGLEDADECVGKNIVANARGAPRCREGPAFVLQTGGIRWKCRGFAIRYSLLTSAPYHPPVPFSLSSSLSRPTSGSSPLRSRTCVSFVHGM